MPDLKTGHKDRYLWTSTFLQIKKNMCSITIPQFSKFLGNGSDFGRSNCADFTVKHRDCKFLLLSITDN